ncbi:MAG TPA: TadE family protein [Bryobacteraceae bacterium]
MASFKEERGSAIIEFTFAGVTVIILLLVIFEMCLAMWSYHTLASAVEKGAIYASTKGQDCDPNYSPNDCRVSVSDIVSRVLQAGVGLDPNRLNVTLQSSGGEVPCNPASSCLSGSYTTTLWPPNSDYVPNIDYVEISASYPVPVAIMSLFWPGQSLAGIGNIKFSASSLQLVQF